MKSLKSIRADLISDEYEPTWSGWRQRHEDNVSNADNVLWLHDWRTYMGERPWWNASIWFTLRRWCALGFEFYPRRDQGDYHDRALVISIGPFDFTVSRSVAKPDEP